jgi:hypothetical protein
MMTMSIRAGALLHLRGASLTAGLALLLGACAPGEDRAAPQAGADEAASADPQDQFWANLSTVCGGAYEGELLHSEGGVDDSLFNEATLVMHGRECGDDEIKIPFHVGADRSRTWVVTRTADGLRLKHDHRHEDGSEDEITWYGGDTRDAGSANRQEFPADEHTVGLNPVYGTNVWTIEIVPGEHYTYHLRREGTPRRFAARFDLTRRVPEPPAPWGHE